MRLVGKSLTESIYESLKESSSNKSLKEGAYPLKYWETEVDRDEGFSETMTVTADSIEAAIAKTRDLYYDSNWASCELGNPGDDEVIDPVFGLYPKEDKRGVEEIRFNGSLKEKENMNDVKSLVWSCLKDTDTVTINDVVNSSNGEVSYDDVVKAAKSLENGGYVSFNENDELITKIMNESVTVTAGSTYVTVDETGVTVDDNGTSITVDGGATVNIENDSIVPMEAPVDDMAVAPEEVVEPVDGELPVENEEPVEGEEETPSEEEVIEPSEELIEPEDELDESVEEGTTGKVTSEDLNSEGVNYVITLNDGTTEYVSCFWSSNDVEPEDIEPGENIEDYGAINYDIYNTNGEQIDGGLLITKEDSFDEVQLCKDLCGLSGYSDDIKVERKENGYYQDVFGLEESAKLKENAGDPNSTVEIYKNPEFDYSIKDITELDNVDVGDVRSIDMFSILNDLEESLQERYGTENWGLLNTFQTRQGKHKKTNESYASAILDISIPKTKKLQELNTVLTVEVYGDKALKECVVKDARYNKRIERFCGKTKNPVKFLENVMVDLINNRAEVKLTNYQPMTEDTKSLKEEVADEAYEIADLIDKRCGDRLQDGVNGERILRRDDFDEEFALACKEVLNLKDEDMDNFWGDEEGSPLKKFDSLSGCDNVWDLENTVRGILGYQGYETIYETDEDRNAYEGDLVVISQEPVNEDVELLVSEPYEDKGMNFADGKAIDKDVKRQQNHLKQHKSLGKVTKKKFDVGKEPDQKNTQGEKVEDITDTVKVEGDKKKKSPSKKKKVEEGVNEDAERIVLTPVKNFDFTDPYGVYYKDDNGNLYKSVDNGNELYICTKAGEPLKDVDASKYMLSDKALNEKQSKVINEYLTKDELKRVEDAYNNDWRAECTADFGYSCKECGRSFDEEVTVTCGCVLDVAKDIEDEGEADPMSHDLPSSCDNCGSADVRITYISSVDGIESLNEAKGLLDDEDTPTESDVEGDSEDLVDVDDELEEGATEVAIFHRKPASVDAMKQAEANGITVNKSNYKIIGTKELSGEEFDKFANHLSSGSYSWLKDMYKVEDSNSGTFNCIEVKNTDDSSMTLLVDPNGYDYARYVAMKTDLAETPEDNLEEPVEEPEEELK